MGRGHAAERCGQRRQNRGREKMSSKATGPRAWKGASRAARTGRWRRNCTTTGGRSSRAPAGPSRGKGLSSPSFTGEEAGLSSPLEHARRLHARRRHGPHHGGWGGVLQGPPLLFRSGFPLPRFLPPSTRRCLRSFPSLSRRAPLVAVRRRLC